MMDETDTRIPGFSTIWQLRHHDTFDRDASPALQSSGENIIQGLYQLWLYTLSEAILDNGNASFSYFHLTWGNSAAARVDIAINPFENITLLKLRRWVAFVSQDPRSNREQVSKHIEERQDAVIWKLAQLHYDLLRKSSRWKTTGIDWAAESWELLERVEGISAPEELLI